jgi:hypothetical protein
LVEEEKKYLSLEDARFRIKKACQIPMKTTKNNRYV